MKVIVPFYQKIALLHVRNVTDRGCSELVQKGFPEREASAMFYPLDIFKTDSDGGVLWRGAAETWVTAKESIKKFALSSPGAYLILDQHTGQRVHLTMPASAAGLDSASNEK
jgi:hypothetical protein